MASNPLAVPSSQLVLCSSVVQDPFVVPLFSAERGRKGAAASTASETEQREALGVLKSPLSSSEPHGQEAGS